MRFTRGNLLSADVEALVNTVNTVGVMGKGIALMFREEYGENYRLYKAACERGEVQIGRIFVTEVPPRLTSRVRWILNFPTKESWRRRSRLEWIEAGLRDLRRVIREKGIRSVAVPPMGCGNGGLRWTDVRPLIEQELGGLDGVQVEVFEPTSRYHNVAKRRGVESLTPARALVAEMIRRYWALGIECSLIEAQKLTYFLDRTIRQQGLDDPLELTFQAGRYGPYADRLRHLLNAMDGSYLHCGKRISDASPQESIWFEERMTDRVAAYLKSEAKEFVPALESTSVLIDGFESPFGMELLATVDWLLAREGCEPTVDGLRAGLDRWPDNAGQRKQRLFDDRVLGIALQRITAPA